MEKEKNEIRIDLGMEFETLIAIIDKNTQKWDEHLQVATKKKDQEQEKYAKKIIDKNDKLKKELKKNKKEEDDENTYTWISEKNVNDLVNILLENLFIVEEEYKNQAEKQEEQINDLTASKKKIISELAKLVK